MKVGKILLGMLAITGVITFFLQSCNSNKDELLSKSVAKSNEFIDFTMSTNLLSKKFLAYTNSLSQEEFDTVMSHINDDEYLADFLNKVGVNEELSLVQKCHRNLLSNKSYLELNVEEQTTLFYENSKKTDQIILKTKAESIEMDECMKRKLDDYAWAQAKADLGAIGCTCAIEVPLVACVCYATVMLNYADDIRQADRAYTDCKKNK